MSYLTIYATRRLVAAPAPSKRARIDECLALNLPGHHGDAAIRAFVEDTSRRRFRRQPPKPRIRLRISDCTNQISLAFEVDSPERRANALHKMDTLLGSLTRFRAAVEAECELYEHRCRHRQR